jgi:hypothetical protein
MPETLPTPASDPLIYTAAITADLGITDRCLREWISLGKFAPPDANISGKNAWLTTTYQREKAAILAGRFKQLRRPSNPPVPADASTTDSPRSQRGCA